MIGGQPVAGPLGAVVFFSDLVCNVNLGGSLWEQPQRACRSGPSRGRDHCQGGLSPVRPQPTFIFLIMETWLVRCRRKVITVRSLSGMWEKGPVVGGTWVS